MNIGAARKGGAPFFHDACSDLNCCIYDGVEDAPRILSSLQNIPFYSAHNSLPFFAQHALAQIFLYLAQIFLYLAEIDDGYFPSGIKDPEQILTVVGNK